MYASLFRMEQVSPGFLFCMDYLMAAVEYIDFAQMMLDFRGPLGPEEQEKETCWNHKVNSPLK